MPKRPWLRKRWLGSSLGLWLSGLSACAPETDLWAGRHDAGTSPAASAAAPAPSMQPTPSAMAPAGPDTEPPAFTSVTVGLVADCVRVRVDLDEPATATITFHPADGSALKDDATLGTGGSRFDLALRLVHIPPGADATAIVSATDAAGNHADADPIALRAPPAASPVVISELMVNPAGPETTQEWVELHNRGTAPAALAGFTIEDEGGSDPLPAVTLAPDERALVVGASFDEQSAADTPPRAGTQVLRVPGRIGRDGLRQSGEQVRLLDADGLVRSSYGGWINAAPAAWSGHSVARAPDESACDHPSAWSTAPQTPTPGW